MPNKMYYTMDFILHCRWGSYLGMEFKFVDALAVTEVMLNAVHGRRVEDPDDAPRARGRQNWPAVIRVVGPGAGVEILVGVGVGVALEELVVS